MKKIITMLILSSILLACSNKNNNQIVNNSKQKNVPSVKVETVVQQSISTSVRVGGTIEPKMQTIITSPSEGSVQSLYFSEGDYVKSGSVIGYVITTDQQNMLATAKADYETMKNNNVDSKMLADAEKRYKTALNLYKPIPVVSPANGVVLSKYVEAGSIVNLRQAIVLVADLNKLIVKTAVSEQYTKYIKVGQTVDLYLPVLGDKKVSGLITLINPAIDVKTRTCGIEVSLLSNNLIKPGMTAVSEIKIAGKDNANLVSHDAIVIKPNGDKIVFVAKDSLVTEKKVITGLESNQLIEILSGISEKELVVIAGNENLKDGAKVKIIKSKNPKFSKSNKGKNNESV